MLLESKPLRKAKKMINVDYEVSAILDIVDNYVNIDQVTLKLRNDITSYMNNLIERVHEETTVDDVYLIKARALNQKVEEMKSLLDGYKL